MRIGTSTSLYLRKRGEQKNRPYIEQLKFCCEAGFKVFDFCGYFSTNPQAEDELSKDNWEKTIYNLANESAKLGAEFSQSHLPFCDSVFVKGKTPDKETLKLYEEMTYRTILASEMLGVKWATIHPLTDNIHDEFNNEVNLRSTKEYYAPFIDFSIAHNIGVCYENMFAHIVINQRDRLRRRYCASAEELCELVDSYKSDKVGVTWDFGHSRIMGHQDQSRELECIGNRLKSTHVQDNNGKKDSHLVPFIGGDIKWENIMPTLKKINYKGDFVLEAHTYMYNMPDELCIDAAKLAYNLTNKCLNFYNKAQI